MGPYMEKNPDMTVEGQQMLSQYQDNSNNLVRLQENFEKAMDGFQDFRSVIERNSQELSDVLTDLKKLQKYKR